MAAETAAVLVSLSRTQWRGRRDECIPHTCNTCVYVCVCVGNDSTKGDSALTG